MVESGLSAVKVSRQNLSYCGDNTSLLHGKCDIVSFVNGTLGCGKAVIGLIRMRIAGNSK